MLLYLGVLAHAQHLPLVLLLDLLLQLLPVPVIGQHVLALVVQNRVKQGHCELYQIQSLEDGQDVPRHLVLNLSVLDDDIGGEGPEANDEVAQIEEDCLQLLDLGWAYLDSHEFLLFYAEVVVDFSEDFVLELQQGFDLLSLGGAGNLLHDPVPRRV